jgi:hypothetical protein
MKRFIAYFDYLGFKDFIMNNPVDYQEKYISHIFRDIENALAKEKTVFRPSGLAVADLANSNLHCINFSDTVIFYTNDDSIESLNEILEVAYIFNWSCIDYFFPVRGCIHLGECVDKKYNTRTGSNGTYSINSLIGSGLIDAYLKAESQSWAGTVITSAVVKFIQEKLGLEEKILSPYAKKFSVPYKDGKGKQEEWVMNLVKVDGKLNDTAFQNMEKNIRDNFSKHNKKVDSPRVIEIIDNTIHFLSSYR